MRTESNRASCARKVPSRCVTAAADRSSNSVSYWWKPTAVPAEGAKANDESKYASANWLNADGPVAVCSVGRHATTRRPNRR